MIICEVGTSLLNPENVGVISVLLAIIAYLLNEKKELKSEIKLIRDEITAMQKERMEENKSIVELTIELMHKIKKFDGPYPER